MRIRTGPGEISGPVAFQTKKRIGLEGRFSSPHHLCDIRQRAFLELTSQELGYAKNTT